MVGRDARRRMCQWKRHDLSPYSHVSTVALHFDLGRNGCVVGFLALRVGQALVGSSLRAEARGDRSSEDDRQRPSAREVRAYAHLPLDLRIDLLFLRDIVTDTRMIARDSRSEDGEPSDHPIAWTRPVTDRTGQPSSTVRVNTRPDRRRRRHEQRYEYYYRRIVQGRSRQALQSQHGASEERVIRGLHRVQGFSSGRPCSLGLAVRRAPPISTWLTYGARPKSAPRPLRSLAARARAAAPPRAASV